MLVWDGFYTQYVILYILVFEVLSAFIKQLRLYLVRSPAHDFPAPYTHPLQQSTQYKFLLS